MTETDKGTKTAEKEEVKKDDKQQVNDKDRQSEQHKEDQIKKPSSGGCCGGH